MRGVSNTHRVEPTCIGGVAALGEIDGRRRRLGRDGGDALGPVHHLVDLVRADAATEDGGGASGAAAPAADAAAADVADSQQQQQQQQQAAAEQQRKRSAAQIARDKAAKKAAKGHQ